MPFPNFEDKYFSPRVFSAADMLTHRRSKNDPLRFPPPEAVIFCLQPAPITRALRRDGAEKVSGFYGDLHLLTKTHGQIAVASRFGIGAPVVAALTEEFAAFGVRRFILIGFAGGLQPDLRAGDIVVCDRAVRDEGTSHHYLPTKKHATANEGMVSGLCIALDAIGQRYAVGTSWTTDAPYRETRGEVEQYSDEGVKTVEMEAAALFAAGQVLQIPVAAAFVVGDTFDGSRWRIDFDARAAERGLQRLFDAAVAALQKD